MKGLLAGKIRRDFQFAKNDKRTEYPHFNGAEFERNQRLVDALESVAEATDRSIAELVIHWTINQPGITSALCGAKRDWQIRETVKAINNPLGPEVLSKIESALAQWEAAENSSQ